MAKKKSSKDENPNPVHVRLEFGEAMMSKKSVLSMEMWILETAKNIETYKLLRIKELTLKEDLKKKIKETKKSLKNLKSVLPEPKMPKQLHKTDSGKETHIEPVKKNTEIENQLLEIQRRLDQLQSEAV